jgi:SAM-dependent methyltransferase
MGIPSNLALLLLKEHNYAPFTGRLLSVGRQTVYLTKDEAFALIERYCGGIRNDHFVQIDEQTRGSKNGEFITDLSFYSLFSNIEYKALDISVYEGADIVWNLCEPLPEAMIEQYDVLINGSCLDNIFDPATAIKNMSRLLNPGGRIIHIERVSRIHHAYVAFSLSWFHDYYAINNFADCKVYLSLWDENSENPWDLYLYDPIIEDNEFFGQDQSYDPLRQSHAIVIAEKGPHSSWDRSPVQFQYRHWPTGSLDIYREASRRFRDHPRPVFSFPDNIPLQNPQYRPCGRVKAR